MYEFTIIVPVYNEEDNLNRVEKELLAYTKIAIKKTAVLFVNDGSLDASNDPSFTKRTAVFFIAILVYANNSFSTRFKLSSSLYTGTMMVNSYILFY